MNAKGDLMPNLDIPALAINVAAALGADWRSVPGNRSAYVEHRDGRRILLDGRGQQGPGTIRLVGCFPPGTDRPGEAIAVPASRSAASIAADITSKLMPGYERALAEVRERLGTKACYTAAREALAARVLQLPGTSRRGAVGGEAVFIQLPGALCTATIRGDGSAMSISLIGVPAETALKILALLPGGEQ